MPRAEIESAATPKKYVPPHERNSGWDAYELDDAIHHLKRAAEISKNKKFLEAIKKHAEKKETEHRESARQMAMLAKSGRISPRALEKMKHH